MQSSYIKASYTYTTDQISLMKFYTGHQNKVRIKNKTISELGPFFYKPVNNMRVRKDQNDCLDDNQHVPWSQCKEPWGPAYQDYLSLTKCN